MLHVTVLYTDIVQLQTPCIPAELNSNTRLHFSIVAIHSFLSSLRCHQYQFDRLQVDFGTESKVFYAIFFATTQRTELFMVRKVVVLFFSLGTCRYLS